MTSEAKRALSRTIRELRKRLIDDLSEATERAYRLSIDAKQAALAEASRVRRARLEGWIDEQVRASGKGDSVARLRADVIKDAAATLLQRIVYLRLLEATGLRSDKVVTGGWESKGYKDFREAAPELVRPGPANETEGYAALLQLVFDELALDLPGLYGPVRMTSLVPVPASTLRAVITALDDDELVSVWTDDTTLGWIYQYWNDPEREALDAKLAASKKLENHEIASKTQMFTERYMVEWLLHNSLGQMWLAMCRKHGWTADVEREGVLDRLEARRVAWRAKREAGEVALDALMPIEPGLEDRWKYWVPQPIPDEAVTSAPDTVRTLKLLDPACGSGHFLVIACDLLFFLYHEEARHRGETWSDREIVESILENNVHGIDIDPRAVQIAAAALMLKARLLCADAKPRTMNLVAPNLSLTSLAEDDPARLALFAAIERETGIPPALSRRILAALAGADHLGTLLKVDTEIDNAIVDWDTQLSQTVVGQGELFGGFGARRRKHIPAGHAKATVLSRLERFLDQHTRGGDLGLRLRGEQLTVGVRFVRLVREDQYDIVVGNPPYQAADKLSDTAYIQNHYKDGKADLFAAFLLRGLQLVSVGGISAFLTMRSWLFLKQYEGLRSRLLHTFSLRAVGDVSWGAFREMKDNPVVMSIVQRLKPGTKAVALSPTDPTSRVRTLEHFNKLVAGLLSQVGRMEFEPRAFGVIKGEPIVYWWSAAFLRLYQEMPKIADVALVREGLTTGDNVRLLRRPWEVQVSAVRAVLRNAPLPRLNSPATWVPYVKGAAGLRWVEPLSYLLHWQYNGIEVKVLSEFHNSSYTRTVRSEHLYFSPGVAFTTTGAEFSGRTHLYQSIFGSKGRSLFGADVANMACLLNSERAKHVVTSLNPTIDFAVSDVERIPVFDIKDADVIIARVESAFIRHAAATEPQFGFRQAGPSAWSYAQNWAQEAVDRAANAPLPVYSEIEQDVLDENAVSFAFGTAMGRFSAEGDGVLEHAAATALLHGILFLSDPGADSLDQPACLPIHCAWKKHGISLGEKYTLRNYLQDRFFLDVHRKMYENRPIYFPLSSSKRSFVAYVSVHRWTATTLNDLLAEHLYPAKKRLEGEQTDLRASRDGVDKKAAKAADKRFGDVVKWLEELNEFIANVEQCAEKGPPPPDAKTKPREVDARYEPDLDDGVMINAAALWPLLEPQWKDPKKWWHELANAEGKKDYDWAHLAKRYFPTRVDAKCKVDPSLAVAHGCFWKYHPAKAYQWELRLQDEIRPDFTLDEVGSDAARAAFEADHADEVEALVTKEHLRRQRKLARGGEATSEDEPQGELELDDEGDEELSA